MATISIHPTARRSRRARWSLYSRAEGAWAVLAIVAVVVAPTALIEGHPVAIAVVVIPGILFGFIRVVAWIAKFSDARS